MKKLLLVYIKGTNIGIKKNQGYPLGLVNLQTYALADPYISSEVIIDIEVYEYDLYDEYFLYKVLNSNYDMILFSTFIWNISRVLELTRKVRMINKKVYLGLGGPEVTDAENILKENMELDLVSIGEGELSFRQIVKRFLLGDTKELLNGVIYRNNNEIKSTGEPVLLENLDDIPTIINHPLVTNSRMILYETSRGCPFQCAYCCWASKRMRFYSLERVEKDLKALLAIDSVEQLFLIDSELDISVDRAKEIMKMIIKYNNNKITVQGFLGLHTIDEDLLKLCKKANFKFGIGIQAISLETLKICNRQWFKKDEMEKKLEIVKQYFEISNIEFQLILGLPGDNYEKFCSSLKWCEENGATHITANRLYVMPGTYFYNNANKYKIIYDKKPYHLIYSNYSYSFEDIIRSELMLYSYKLIRLLFKNEKIVTFGKKKLVIWEFIESFAQLIGELGIYPQGRQESQIITKDYDNVKLLNECLNRMGFSELAFHDLISMLMTKNDATNYFAENKKNFLLRYGADGNSYKVDAYYFTPYVETVKKDDIEIINYGQCSIFYVFNYKTAKMKSILILNIYKDELKYLMDILLNGMPCEKSRLSEFNLYLFDYMIENYLVYKI